MARVESARVVIDDSDRVMRHRLANEASHAEQRVSEMLSAIDALALNPLIGRPVEGGKRELVIGRDTRGYVALYRYSAEFDIVFVLAVRAQRESGCFHE